MQTNQTILEAKKLLTSWADTINARPAGETYRINLTLHLPDKDLGQAAAVNQLTSLYTYIDSLPDSLHAALVINVRAPEVTTATMIADAKARYETP